MRTRSSPGLTAAFALALMSATMAVPACAHASPERFATCMQDSGKGAALINAVNGVLDGDNRVQTLEQLAIAVGPDVLRCVLEQVAAKRSAGGDSVGTERARRAREYLDSHGGSAARAAPPQHLTLQVPIGRGAYESLEVDPATQMTGARPIGLSDYNDVACKTTATDRKTGQVVWVRWWYCEST